MTAGDFLGGGLQFLNICAVYYAIQLVRCATFSYGVFAAVFVLRKTVLKNRAFLKGALWSLFIPVLFMGKMKFFYESEIGISLFSWQTVLFMDTLVCVLYLSVAFVYGMVLLRRRIKLKKSVLTLEKKEISDTHVYVTDLPVTPFVIGVFKPKIVLPKVITEEYTEEELKSVLLHEKTHIKLGHLLIYCLWDILRALLWINPFLIIGARYLREDMEEICDLVTIKRSGIGMYDYGQLLLKSIRLLKSENKKFNIYAAFAGDIEYRNIKRRFERIAAYKPYKNSAVFAVLTAITLCAAGAVLWTQNVSYGRYNSHHCIVIYDVETETIFSKDNEGLREAVYYDENYIYIETSALNEFIYNSGISGENIHIYLDGFYKLPGIGAGSGGFGYLETADSGDDVIKIDYVETEDFFSRILKLILISV